MFILLGVNLLIFNALLAQTPELEIWEIQGDQLFSPYLNETVQTNQNVVTAVGNDFFFIQTPDYRADVNTATSNGIKVITNNTPCLLYTSPSPRDATLSRMPSSA